MNDHRGPTALLDRAMAFQTAKLVLTALDIGLFDLLADQPSTAEGIRQRLGLHPRGTEHFLAALVELGLLHRDGEVYRNDDDVTDHLTTNAPASLGGFLRVAEHTMYPAWGRLARALRTGEPQAGTGGGDLFAELYSERDTQDHFIRMAESVSRPLIPALDSAFDWDAYRSVVELGGCRGDVLGNLVLRHPHLEATVLDLPALESAFRRHMDELGTTDRVRFHGADFFSDPLPRADVVLIGHCMVDWTDEQRIALIGRVAASAPPGGMFLIWDPMLAEGSDGQLRNLVRSLNLQLMTPHGSGYRLDDCVRWLREAGFSEVAHQFLGVQDATLVIARKADPANTA